jgi:hypothetical protein
MPPLASRRVRLAATADGVSVPLCRSIGTARRTRKSARRMRGFSGTAERAREVACSARAHPADAEPQGERLARPRSESSGHDRIHGHNRQAVRARRGGACARARPQRSLGRDARATPALAEEKSRAAGRPARRPSAGSCPRPLRGSDRPSPDGRWPRGQQVKPARASSSLGSGRGRLGAQHLDEEIDCARGGLVRQSRSAEPTSEPDGMDGSSSIRRWAAKPII